MGFNVSQIINKQLGVQEQSAYNLKFIPPNKNSLIVSGWSVDHFSQLGAGFKNIGSVTQGGFIRFRFYGRHIGVLLVKASANGILNFYVDGTFYKNYDCSQVGDPSLNPSVYNVPVMIASDLSDGEHILTIMKEDAKNTGIQGFLIDDAGNGQYFVTTGVNYHQSLEVGGAASGMVQVGTTSTTIRGTDTWILCATLTNTTASPINVTLINGVGNSIAGPFPVPSNDIRQIQGPMYFQGSMKASASATGVSITIGGQ
jgi:hypothetical protein